MAPESPIVTFARNGQELSLGRTGTEPTIHTRGATGLGVAPVDIAKSDRLAGDGSIVRGVRYTDRDVFIPLYVRQPTMGDLHLWRRDLARLLAPVSGDPDASVVEVRVADPATGTVRTVRGIYKDGLSGDFGDTYHDVWQTLGLVIECADPWWLGPERTRTLQLNVDDLKPFLSTTVPFFPVILAESTVQDEWTIRIEGDALVWPSWEITGPGNDLLIESSTGERVFIAGDFPAGSVTRIDTRNGRIIPDRWDDVSLDSRLFGLQPGSQTIRVSMVGATADTIVRLVWQERYLEAI